MRNREPSFFQTKQAFCACWWRTSNIGDVFQKHSKNSNKCYVIVNWENKVVLHQCKPSWGELMAYFQNYPLVSNCYFFSPGSTPVCKCPCPSTPEIYEPILAVVRRRLRTWGRAGMKVTEQGNQRIFSPYMSWGTFSQCCLPSILPLGVRFAS